MECSTHRPLATFPDDIAAITVASYDHNNDDDLLLLDDVNVAQAPAIRCWKCHGTGVLPQSDAVEWTASTGGGDDNQLLHAGSASDLQLEDTPLLLDDQIGHLSMKNYHCHASIQQPNNAASTHAFRTLCIVSAISLSFMILEIIGGHIAGSLAVMTDAAHLFSDVIGFLVSIISIWISKWPQTKQMTFGFQRVEVLGALLSVLTVWLLAGIFSFLAVGRIVRGDTNIDANMMLLVAAFGVGVNIIMGAFLHGVCLRGHPHAHDGSAHQQRTNINVRAAAAHVVGDLLQSVGIVLAAIVIKVYPAAAVADPICTVLFSALIVGVTFRVARDSALVLVEGTRANVAGIAVELHRLDGVRHVHDMRAWCIAPGRDALVVHVAVDAGCDRDALLDAATRIAQRYMDEALACCAIQIEAYDPEQTAACLECQR